MYQFIQDQHHYVLSVDNPVSLMEALTAFCKDQNILSGTIGCLGAINEATFRFLDPATKQYVE